MKIEVEKLNDAISFVKSGLSANSYIELAGTVTILVKEGNLYFITEPDDGEVKYETKVCAVPNESDTAVAINGFQFCQAVGTCSNTMVDLTILEDRLSLNNGRGSLYFPILIDDNGERVFNTLGAVEGDELKVSSTETLKLVTSCVSATMDNIGIRNIYCNKGITLTSDLVNIARGPEVLNTEILVTNRMKEFLLKYPEAKVYSSDTHFTMVCGDKVAFFTKDFQTYIQEVPVDALKAEFENEKLHSFTVNMEEFRNALSFLKVATNSMDDYAVTLRMAGPTSIELESDMGSKQTLTVTWLTDENEPWEVQFDCASALQRFVFTDGIRQIDIYESNICCVGPVEISLGLILEDI